jgi:hypothetical protein
MRSHHVYAEPRRFPPLGPLGRLQQRPPPLQPRPLGIEAEHPLATSCWLGIVAGTAVLAFLY